MNSAVSWTSMGLAKAPSAFCTCMGVTGLKLSEL